MCQNESAKPSRNPTLSIPTSNHNQLSEPDVIYALFIFLFLHQTTTRSRQTGWWRRLFIFLFLHQTTTHLSKRFQHVQLFIFLFLHQTTTRATYTAKSWGCLSFYSYIKPQLVVAVANPDRRCLSFYSYIKPQPSGTWGLVNNCCLSFYSYIKPQPSKEQLTTHTVVYLSIPTSNHNTKTECLYVATVVYLSIPTSNHNKERWHTRYQELFIFLFLHQTTTWHIYLNFRSWLFIFLFLHQTTTIVLSSAGTSGCLSFYSYIKPQRERIAGNAEVVVYLSIPTSNHNLGLFFSCRSAIYAISIV